MEIRVREYLGENLRAEDAILLRGLVDNNIDNGINLNFEGINKVSTTFLTSLFSDLIYRKGRKKIIDKVNVKNLSNKTDYSRVVMGTTF
ncbi:MAG: STAS-like domain-containing protein [Sarcina sp.]